MKVYIHRLGCPKNDVDADYIAGRLIADGHQLVEAADGADAVVVNSCCFIESAKQETIDETLQMTQLKDQGVIKRVYVAGCFAQRFGTELLDGMPEIDGAFGLGQLDAISEAVGTGTANRKPVATDAKRLDYLSGPRAITDDFPYAYLKISDGCNRPCTYCVIPKIRGNFRSRSIEEIATEAELLVDQGKRELILVSQDATLYGGDLEQRSNIIQLLQRLDNIADLDWIRLMYLHPRQTTDELIQYVADESNKTVPYFDLPLQHVNSEMLKRMKRQTDRERIEQLIEKIRVSNPNFTIRTTFIVGFPGETEEQFGEILEFLEQHQLDRVGAFTYSQEDGSPAAEMDDQIDQEEKERRLDELMSLQREIAFDKNESLIGSEQLVMLDRLDSPTEAVGRTRGDCPEIDQEVAVRGRHLKVGEVCRVLITGSRDYDLEGTKRED